jgi:hypothetical protein
MKARVSLGVSKFTVPEMIEKSRHLVSSMTGNENFVSPVPVLASISSATNELETAYTAAQGGGLVQTALLREKQAVLSNLLSLLVNYVELLANGNEVILLSSGMPLKAKGSRQPAGFSVDDGKHPGELLIHFNATKNAMYMVEMIADPLPDATAPDNGHNWKHLGGSIKASFVAVNLVAGIRYWFRFATVTKSGQSLWSHPISKIVTT